MTGKEPGLFWHVHHDVLFEWCYDADARRAYIKNNKPQDEIDTRIRLMKPVRGDLGDAKTRDEYAKACDEYAKASAKYDQARAEYAKTRDEYAKACDEYAKALAEYHKALADYERAWAEYDQARAEYAKARAESKQAWADHDTVRAKYLATIRPGEVEALHAIECPDCPWDGKTIFPTGG